MDEDRLEGKLDQLLDGQALQREMLASLKQSHDDLAKKVEDHHVVLFGDRGADGLRLQLKGLTDAHNERQRLCVPPKLPEWWQVAGTAVLVNVVSYGVIAVLAFWMYMAVVHGKP